MHSLQQKPPQRLFPGHATRSRVPGVMPCGSVFPVSCHAVPCSRCHAMRFRVPAHRPGSRPTHQGPLSADRPSRRIPNVRFTEFRQRVWWWIRAWRSIGGIIVHRIRRRAPIHRDNRSSLSVSGACAAPVTAVGCAGSYYMAGTHRRYCLTGGRRAGSYYVTGSHRRFALRDRQPSISSCDNVVMPPGASRTGRHPRPRVAQLLLSQPLLKSPELSMELVVSCWLPLLSTMMIPVGSSVAMEDPLTADPP
jgi:hypothetical protein